MAICRGCAKEFTSSHGRVQFYCDSGCRRQSLKREYRRLNPAPLIPPGTVGAISELRVSVDLLRQGVHIFRALSPNCPCDLVILRNGIALRVEVRTGYRTKDKMGKIQFPNHRKDKGKYDVIAIVLPDEIIYQPSLVGLLSLPLA